MNTPVMNGHDVNIPAQEPMVAMMNLPRMAAELDDQVDDNRAEQLAASAPALPFYLAEKYFWKQSGNNRFYLSPIPAYLKYVEETAARAAQFGLGLIYPDGEHGKTEESGRVDIMIEEASNLLESFRATSENEAQAFERFLIERCTRNAIYAATTQYELEQWSARAAAQGQDPSEHQNYGEKESRLESFALAAGIAFAVVKGVLPTADLSGETFAKAARKTIYDQANFEGRKLLNPAQLDEQKTAAVEAAKVTARRF